jgi:hypothetical protein
MLKLHQVLKSSRAAIDLASIMVGIIVIGLIGGVIAATVFAVIPWAQNNAAKQQLDSVVSAESSYRGLSADKDTTLQNAAATPTNQSDPNQVVLNSTFTGSAGLAKNNLLALNANGLYCVIATVDGKDYHAYSKSGSGQWFYATSGKTQPTEYTGSTPCVMATDGTSTAPAGIVDTGVDNGSGAVPTTPSTGGGNGGTTTPAPNPTVLATYDMENGGAKPGWSSTDTATTISASPTGAGRAHSGTYDMFIEHRSTLNPFSGARFTPNTATPAISFVSGKNYTVDAWINNNASNGNTTTYVNPTMTVGGVTSSQATQFGWSKVSVTFTADNTTAQYITFQTTKIAPASGSNYFRVDDITITQNN